MPLPFLLLFSAHLFFFLVPHSLFCFRHVALLSLAENIIFSPKRFSTQTCCSFSASLPFFFFLPTFLKASPKLVAAQKVLASAQTLFQFSATLSVPFQRLPFFFSLAPFIQDPIFSLVASHLFYLNKSLFSSNL